MNRAGTAHLVEDAVEELVQTALGRQHRSDPIAPVTGGPAGNARLTAWLGLVLLVLALAELVTVLDITGLIAWHVAIGLLMVPPALAKTASTTWRFARYYARHRPYVTAGPPPLLLRLLGPLVVLTTLALLGTGAALIAVGPETGRTSGAQVLGVPLTVLLAHKAVFVAWVGATGVHVLARLVPAWQLTIGAASRAVPGQRRRGALVAASAAGGVVLSLSLLATVGTGGWGRDGGEHHRHSELSRQDR